LSEPIEKYSSYFDALLIQRRSHTAFFQDLKDFRCQEHIIALLTSHDSAQDIKTLYRTCSKSFLGSRFAHPWCRSTPSKEGWFEAEWGSIKKQSEAKRKEEDQLHRLLVPIWCGFRVRMIPSDEQMEKFLQREREMMERLPVHIGNFEPQANRVKRTDAELQKQEPAAAGSAQEEIKTKRLQIMGDAPVRFNAEAYVAEEDDRVYEETQNAERDVAEAAAKLFVGVAAT
ncbi:MAG: hypothetical protein M1823_007431, partial [Watsoniomyces obsoletus]